MVDILVIDSTPGDTKELSKTLQEVDLQTMRRLGVQPEKILNTLYNKSLYSRSAFINGKLAAMWGLMGVYLGQVGYPWLLMTPSVEDYPFRVVFRYRKELQEMLQLFPSLVEFVDPCNKKSIRLLELMGFTLGEYVEIGNGTFIKAEKKQWA